MPTSITIRDAIKPKNSPSNQFELVVKFMHGDADSYSTSNAFFRTEEELLKILDTLMYMKNSGWSEVYNCLSQISLVKEVLAKAKLDEDEVDHFLDDWVIYDVTSSGNAFAQVDNLEVFWYNSSGQKHHVQISYRTNF